jgi:hypothetical protein
VTCYLLNESGIPVFRIGGKSQTEYLIVSSFREPEGDDLLKQPALGCS